MSDFKKFANYDSNNPLSQGPFAFLPDEVILKIFQYLPVNEILKCATVSRRWRNLCLDRCFWDSKLSLESKKWIGVVSNEEAKSTKLINSADHPLEKFKSTKRIYYDTVNINSIKVDIFTRMRMFVMKSLTNYQPNISVYGTGLDSLVTGEYFVQMFRNKCLYFEPVSPFIVPYGSGVTMRILDSHFSSYKFNIFMIYSCRPRLTCIDTKSQFTRINKSQMIGFINDNPSEIKLEIKDDLKVKLQKTDGFIYSIDMSALADITILSKEFNLIIDSLLPHTPVVILVICNKNDQNIPLYNLANLLDLYSLKRRWCLFQTNLQEVMLLKSLIIWLIQNKRF